MPALAGRRAMVEGFASAVAEVSLHAGDPGDSGAGELSGGVPAYQRARVRFAVVTDDAGEPGAELVDEAVLIVPGRLTVTHVGFWSRSGEWMEGTALDVEQPFTSAGTVTLAAGSLRVTVDG